MKDIWLRLQCSGKLCELLPDDLENGERLIKDLLTSVLDGLPWFAMIEDVMLQFLRFQNMYVLRICVWCFDSFTFLSEDFDHLEVMVESLVEPALLQLLGEVFSLEYPD